MTSWRRRQLSAAACALVVALIHFGDASSAEAQSRRSPPRPRRPARATPHAGSWELSGGFLWQGGFDLGSATAELTRPASGGSGPYDLFRTGTRLAPGIGAQARVAGYVSEHLALEAGLRVTRPVLTVRLTNDVESAPNVSAEETLTQYVFDGSAVWHFGAIGGGRGVPFVAGGAGYIRDLHEGSELMETGTEYHALAGLKWWFSDRPRRLGVRGEVGLSIRDGGFDFREGRRSVPVAAASLTYLF